MALSTKNLGDNKRISKVLEPGNHTLEIESVKLESSPFKEGGYHLQLTVEGPDLGADFEGFFKDMNDPSKGRFKGQSGRVKTNEYVYADGETKGGIKVYRDQEIMKMLKNLCSAMGTLDWFDAQDGKHDTIEQFVAQFNADAPFRGKKLRMCIAGREYTNKQGYTNYDLHIAKGARGFYAYESAQIPEDASKLMKFNPAIHIKKNVKKEEKITSFEKPVTPATRESFSLD